VAFDSSNPAEYEAVIGCDEVGRGSLCGPVLVAAVWFEPAAIPTCLLGKLDDSKVLTPKVRTRLAIQIRLVARVAVAWSTPAMIDKHGIRKMTLDAMSRAILRLNIHAPVRVDGLDVPPGISLPSLAIVKGDAKVPQIAAASIVAKVMRDKMMAQLSIRHPGYGWERNAGYGTPEHLAAIESLGVTVHHRMSFAPMSQQCQPLLYPTTTIQLGGTDDAEITTRRPLPSGRYEMARP
jgi:ribonuclease HII